MPNIPDTVTGSYREEWLLADYIIKQVVQQASGGGTDECHYNYPKDVYFIGNLRPREENEVSLSRADLMNKLAPSAFGAEFKLKVDGEEMLIDVELSWDCYYRAFPSYQQQINWLRNLNEDSQNESPESESVETPNADAVDETATETGADRRQARQPREDLFIRFKKLSCNAKGRILINRKNGEWNTNTSVLEESIQNALQSAIAAIADDDERLRLRIAGQLFTLPQNAIENEQAYSEFLRGLRIEPQINWNWEIVPEIYQTEESEGEIILLIQFVNATHYEQGDRSVEPYFFNSVATFKFKSNIIIPFELELAPKSFRYDRNMWGRGFNCGLERLDEKSYNFYQTTHTPIYTQWRYKTREEPEARFEELANNPIPVLHSILTAMRLYTTQWDEQEREFADLYGNQWDRNHRQEYLADKAKFEQEIYRFEQGLNLIENDNDILLAFKLANESFRRAGHPQKNKWRLFQIVFLVTQIPGMAALNPSYEKYLAERDFVDIVYFPTGGGKTEAYLATLVFHCFYDRLHGKTAGVTCWIRFPLRLLTLQQTQRLADIIGTAEIVRAEQEDDRLSGNHVDPFAVGYFVGAEATPNEIKAPQNGRPEPDWSMAQDQTERQKWKRVVTCPSCKTNSVSVEFNEETVQVQHQCCNKDCRFVNGIIPVYVIDNEIYRYLPTVMVGTIDKLAGIGNQRKLSLVFGKVDGRCEVHGYFNSICCQKECKDRSRLKNYTPKGISGPTLFLQDELHLLKEGLGTFDSHYETFAQYLIREAGSKTPLKIIASSATIEQYERQVEHLYGKEPSLARVFPGTGPTLRNSFYAQTEDYPQRIFVGILPHNKTIFNAVLEIIEYYHRLLQRLAGRNQSQNPYAGSITPGTNEWNRTMDLYYSSLTYFLASRDLGSIKNDIESHINNTKFLNEGLNPVQIKELTGGTSTDEVTRILEQLEAFHPPDQAHESVLATNMVSHGVDVDRFNCMIFYGIPRQNAEYIQASSRVGRSHVGIVFNCFHPIRERDQSHYSYFNKYHEFLGQMVEPVAINRWSAYGIDKTLPGLFMGTVLQILSNRDSNVNRNAYYMLDKISQMYQTREIDKDEIKEILKSAFRAGIPDDERNTEVERKIDQTVDIYFDNISNPGTNSGFLSNALIPRPMRSLRDIDDPIEIELGRLGERWANMN